MRHGLALEPKLTFDFNLLEYADMSSPCGTDEEQEEIQKDVCATYSIMSAPMCQETPTFCRYECFHSPGGSYFLLLLSIIITISIF